MIHPIPNPGYEICDCCGQPGGVCPSCGARHSPAVGHRSCELCIDQELSIDQEPEPEEG